MCDGTGRVKVPDMPDEEELEIALKYDALIDSCVGYNWHVIDAENYHTLAAAYRALRADLKKVMAALAERNYEYNSLLNISTEMYAFITEKVADWYGPDPPIESWKKTIKELTQ